MSSIVYGFAKADTMKKEVPTFYKFEQTVREIDDINGDDKKQDCYDVLDDFDSSRSSISINNRLMELLGWEDYNTFSIMRGIIKGRIRQSNITEGLIKRY